MDHSFTSKNTSFQSNINHHPSKTAFVPRLLLRPSQTISKTCPPQMTHSTGSSTSGSGNTNNLSDDGISCGKIATTATDMKNQRNKLNPHNFLIPSQSIISQAKYQHRPAGISSTSTRSSKLYSKPDHMDIMEDEAGGDVIIQYTSSSFGEKNHKEGNTYGHDSKSNAKYDKQHNGRTKNQTNYKNITTATTTTPSQKLKKYKYTGNLPDIYWRAIPMDHLRSHPNYKPLPKSYSITQIHKLEDVRFFRQDSWQWDMLHSGRCTTSQATPALGLLEPNAARLLGIPRSLQKGCMGAYTRLGQRALRTLEEMNSILCCHDDDDDYDSVGTSVDAGTDNVVEESVLTNGSTNNRTRTRTQSHYNKVSPLWKRMSKKRYPFAARYQRLISTDELNIRRAATKKYMSTISSPFRIRMNWGNSQEATAILTALNYFHTIDPGVTIKEVGMCGAGLGYNSTRTSKNNDLDLLLGASPDAVIQYSNGTLEALEVKNHCPFVPSRKAKGEENSYKKKNKDNYRIREMPMKSSVPPAYIPQLMMEMMCLGDDCRSAVMCRQTATNGAIIVRLRRDDEWIAEMIFWLERFVDEYVQKDEPPQPNFFWFDDDKHISKRYQKFVNRTKEISDEVELVKDIPHGSIQRALGYEGERLPLFLD